MRSAIRLANTGDRQHQESAGPPKSGYTPFTAKSVSDATSNGHLESLANRFPAYSVITDLICALLPVIVLWNVKITLKTKIGICGLMSLGLIATAVAIVRASSLGIATADLSYDYAIAAIWANTELHIGIIATNLALSRMIWVFIKGGTKSNSSTNPPRYGTGSQSSRSRAGYVKSSHRSEDRDDCLETRASFDNQSQASHIPLDPIIKETTTVRISSNPLQTPTDSKELESNWGHERDFDENDEISQGLRHDARK